MTMTPRRTTSRPDEAVDRTLDMKNCFRDDRRHIICIQGSMRHPLASLAWLLSFPVFQLSTMALDGLIILDPSGRPIITSHFHAHPPNYPLLHIDAYNAALARRKSPYAGTAGTAGVRSAATTGCAEVVKDEMEPVIWVSVPVGRTARVRRGKQKIGGAGYGSDSEDDDSEDDGSEEEEDGDEEGEQMGGTWVTAGLCHIEREGMSFLAPLSHEGQSPNVTFLSYPSAAYIDSCIPTALIRVPQ